MIEKALPAQLETNQTNADILSLTERTYAGDGNAKSDLLSQINQLEADNESLRRSLRKKEFDFSTLFEIVGQTSARSLDLNSMQTYLMRTVSGHFTTPKLLIMRTLDERSGIMQKTAAQGVPGDVPGIATTSKLCALALEKRTCLTLDQLPEAIQETQEARVLKNHGMHLIVPLIQEVDTTDTHLEGLLVLGKRLANRTYQDVDVMFLNTLGKMLAICLRNEALYRRSIIDDLTGVASRGHFDARLSQEINRIEIYGHRSLGLLMLDVDKFKSFNDTFGHQTGDRVLQEISRTLTAQVRNVDLVARYGGEEFAVILLEIDRAQILQVATRLRKAIEKIDLKALDGTTLKVTASVGAACFPDDAETKSELIQAADKALYCAKDNGRNLVVLAPSREKNPTVALPRIKAGDSSERLDAVERRRPSERARPADLITD